MKGCYWLNLNILLALLLPIAINAEGYGVRVARKQLLRINKLEDNAYRFYHMRAYEIACSKITEANLLIGMNFEGLQKLSPDVDWLEYKKYNLKKGDIYCGSK